MLQGRKCRRARGTAALTQRHQNAPGGTGGRLACRRRDLKAHATRYQARGCNAKLLRKAQAAPRARHAVVAGSRGHARAALPH